MLNEHTRYSRDLLFKFFNKVLDTYSIKDRIMSISRDNVAPVIKLIETIKENYEDNGPSNIIDVPCLVHILNIVTNILLKYIFFNLDDTKKFKAILKNLKNEASSKILYKSAYNLMSALPPKIRSIISAFNNNHYLKNTLRKRVQLKNTRNPNKLKPDTLFNPEKLLRDNTTR